MSDISSTSARVQIEAGFDDGRRFHRISINGQDVGLQVGSVDFHAEGDQPSELRVTFVNPDLTIEGFANIIGSDVEADRG